MAKTSMKIYPGVNGGAWHYCLSSYNTFMKSTYAYSISLRAIIKKKFDMELEAWFQQAAEKGMKAEEAAKILGISKSTVRKWAKLSGTTLHNPKQKKAETDPLAALNDPNIHRDNLLSRKW